MLAWIQFRLVKLYQHQHYRCNYIARSALFNVLQTVRSVVLFPLLSFLESIDKPRFLFAHKVLSLLVIDAHFEDLQNGIAFVGGRTIYIASKDNWAIWVFSTHIYPFAPWVAARFVSVHGSCPHSYCSQPRRVCFPVPNRPRHRNHSPSGHRDPSPWNRSWLLRSNIAPGSRRTQSTHRKRG